MAARTRWAICCCFQVLAAASCSSPAEKDPADAGPDAALAVLTIDVDRYDVGAALVGIASVPGKLIVTNAGSTRTSALATSIEAPFAATGTCTDVELDPGTSCTVDVVLTPSGAGTFEHPLVISALSGGQAEAAIVGEGLDAGTLRASLDSIGYGPIAIDVDGAVRELLVSNAGALAVSGAIAVRVTGQDAAWFTIGRNECADYSLASNGLCGLEVRATARRSGSARATLAITSPTGGAAIVPLAASAFVAESLSITGASSITFPATAIGAMSSPQTFVLTNTGTAETGPITAEWNLGAQFAVANNGCASGLQPAGSCSIEVLGAPTAAGVHASTLRIQGQLSGGVMATGLVSAPALATLDVESPSLTFPNTQVGTLHPAASAVVRIFNRGDTAVSGLTVTTDTSDFVALVGPCTTIAARGFCTLAVSFKPGAVGQRTATLTVTSQAQMRTIVLSGIGAPGTNLRFNAAAVFPLRDVGTTQDIALTLTNSTGTTVTLNVPMIATPFAIQTSSCGATILDGASCTITVRFAPSAPGVFVGTLSVPTSDGTVIASLSGTARGQFNIPTAGSFRIFPPPETGGDLCSNSCIRTSRFASWEGTYVPEPSSTPAQTWGMLAGGALLCNGVGRAPCATVWPHTSLTAMHQ
jgi:hypothetical protein